MYLERFLVDFTVFRVFLGILRVCDRTKYQKPWVLQAIINKYCVGNEIYKMMQTGQSQNIAATLPTCCQLLATSWLTVSCRSADSWWEISPKSNSLPTDNIGLWKTLHIFSHHRLPFSAFDKQPYTVNCFNNFYWLQILIKIKLIHTCSSYTTCSHGK